MYIFYLTLASPLSMQY